MTDDDDDGPGGLPPPPPPICPTCQQRHTGPCQNDLPPADG
jgi:hypothetical protein